MKRQNNPSKAKGKKVAPGVLDTTEADKNTPKSVVIYRGEVGPKIRALMHEWRRVFLPWSSKRLHARSNTIKDFLSIASTLSLSHLHLLASPPSGSTLRILRFSSGPTLTFGIDSFALREDFVDAQKKPAPVMGPAYDAAPIVVLSNFKGHGPQVELMESTFQNMYPSVNIHTMKPSEVQRVAMFRYDADNDTVEVRHYYINAKAVGLTKTVKKLLDGKVPSRLHTLDTVDEVLDKEGAWSDTDGEGEEVPLSRPFRSHKGQCRVKLAEIGPRLTLSLTKVEAGFGDGEVIYHKHEHKTPEERLANAQRVRSRKNEKAKRRREQESNVERKKSAKEEKLNAKKRRRLEREQERKDEFGGGSSSDEEQGGGGRRGVFEEVGSGAF